jgi:hypothetical protein
MIYYCVRVKNNNYFFVFNLKKFPSKQIFPVRITNGTISFHEFLVPCLFSRQI